MVSGVVESESMCDARSWGIESDEDLEESQGKGWGRGDVIRGGAIGGGLGGGARDCAVRWQGSGVQNEGRGSEDGTGCEGHHFGHIPSNEM